MFNGKSFYRVIRVTILGIVLTLSGCQSARFTDLGSSPDITDVSTPGFTSNYFSDYLYQNVSVTDYKFVSSLHKTSRTAAVRVTIDYGYATISGSGTYFKWKGHTMVVTAAHLYALGGGTAMHDEALIITPGEKVLGKLVYIDKIVDVAVFAVPTLDTRRPARFNRATDFPIGEEVVYSGFPGANNLLTFEGVLTGDGYNTDIAMQSFAWGGSSGSGVFNSRGEYVGVLVSIMVGPGFQGPQLAGSVVYIAPATLVDSALLRYRLDKLARTKNRGF